VKIIVAGGGTGGHLYPGLAIARALVRLDPSTKPIFIGARRGIERKVLPTTEFEYELLDLHPLYRSRPWENWRTLAGAFGAWRSMRRIVKSERPALVLGTGGYAAAIALAYGVVHRIPIVLQEQNSHPGLTMRLFSRFAREIYLGYPEVGALMPRGSRTELVDSGNPIEPPPSPRPDRSAARRLWRFPEVDGIVLLIVGGSQGAVAVNEAVSSWLDAGGGEGVNVIWATGAVSYDRFRRHESDRVRVRAYLSPITDAYAAADLALARAGAMTTAELCAWGIPAILVPLPTAAADHQSSNARALESAGAALSVPQAEFTVDRLRTLVRELTSDPHRLEQLSSAALARGRPNAADSIARRILQLAGGATPRS
jgi:UDP-N-acetylglucosamine--N-acetylmuramyl-(pentapeptide) pyrophosphoryl-undecaprenol N-acetylglucosamine transferase